MPHLKITSKKQPPRVPTPPPRITGKDSPSKPSPTPSSRKPKASTAQGPSSQFQGYEANRNPTSQAAKRATRLRNQSANRAIVKDVLTGGPGRRGLQRTNAAKAVRKAREEADTQKRMKNKYCP
jgi:hypothetical protein